MQGQPRRGSYDGPEAIADVGEHPATGGHLGEVVGDWLPGLGWGAGSQLIPQDLGSGHRVRFLAYDRPQPVAWGQDPTWYLFVKEVLTDHVGVILMPTAGQADIGDLSVDSDAGHQMAAVHGASVPLSAKAQVMAKEQAAVGYALTGNRHRVDQLLDEIETSLDDAATENHAWGGDRLRSSAGRVVNLHRAHCYGRLGLGHEAAELWSQMNPEGFGDRHDQGVYLARQAAALLDVGEPKAAARHVELTSTLYSRTGSARMRRELVRLHEKTVPLSTTKAGSDLAEALDQVLTPSGT